MEAELYKQNPWWTSKWNHDSIPREKYVSAIMERYLSNEIIILTGLRRIGKTTILRQIIAQLLHTTKPQDILFVSLDSFSLIQYTIHDIIKSYREIHKKKSTDSCTIILDEVTAKSHWEQELKSIHDTENVKLICSSSIATMMRDSKAYLTGRTITIEIMPLSFQEFLLFKEAKLSPADPQIVNSYFKDYLRLGGIPDYVLIEDSEYLQELVQSIIYKDIIAQHNITHEKAIQELFVLLCERVGKPMSYSKIARILHLSVDSVKRYISFFEKSYLFYTVDKYARSYNEKITAPKKVYIGDVGIKNMITGFRDLGASYENLVFLKIKHLRPSYFSQNFTELDFVSKEHVIEAKYGSILSAKQQKMFDALKQKNKIVANGAEFFLNEL